jgi:acyl-CoA synthetase (AMP-forming)/AMP-acid ligase II
MHRIDELISEFATRTPDAACTVWNGKTQSYLQVESAIHRLHESLGRAGVRPGDRVAVLSTPRPEYLLLLMAISRACAVYVGIHPRYTAREVAGIVTQVRPRAIVALSEFEGRSFRELFNAVGQLVEVPATVYFDDGCGVIDAVANLNARAPLPPTSGIMPAAPNGELDGAAAIVMTSGTTGTPKAAILSHAGLLIAATVQHERLNPPQPRYLCNLPVNHVGCLMNLTLSALVGGGSIVFQERFQPAQALQLMVDHAVTCWLQIPTMFNECAQHPNFDPQALHRLHSICIGGGAASFATIRRLRAVGARMFVIYGQTETTSAATWSDPFADDDVLENCIGRFDPGFEFRIADDYMQPCPVDVVGEIQGRGPLIFFGYFGDPEATRAAFTDDGWLRTGDLASQRADGNIVLKGRLKELIRSGGYNIYPREVELAIERHPGVAHAVVFGLPDDRLGETAHAVVELASPETSRQDLDQHCRGQLANYKVPKSFRVVPSLPLLANGKVDRRGICQMASTLAALA